MRYLIIGMLFVLAAWVICLPKEVPAIRQDPKSMPGGYNGGHHREPREIGLLNSALDAPPDA